MPKVLYVEDEPLLAKIVKESLESRGYEIIHRTDGKNIKDVFELCKPDLCILDIMLPERDGYTLAEAIREVSEEIPIIFLTAKSQPSDVINGFKRGGNDYIKKPFSMEELILRIENLINLTAKQEVSLESAHIGNFIFSPLTMELKHKDGIIKLSHREVEILKLLLAHKNRKIDRKKILMDVWGDDSFFNSRNLDVYMRKIRKYFEREESVKILTLKGVGYHFVTGRS